MWEAAGIPFRDLLDRLIQFGLERHAARSQTRFRR
jgi:hypothetical protein